MILFDSICVYNPRVCVKTDGSCWYSFAMALGIQQFSEKVYKSPDYPDKDPITVQCLITSKESPPKTCTKSPLYIR